MLVLVLVFEVYTIIVVYTEGDAALPAMFGNFERVRSLLVDEEQREKLYFAAVGDTRIGPETFERICEKMKDEPLWFMVLLGDCVRKGTGGYHRFLRSEWAEELALAEVHPWLKNNLLLAITLNLGILGILFWVFRRFLRNRRAL